VGVHSTGEKQHFLPLKRSSNLAFSNRWDYIQYLAEEYLRDPGELEVIYRLKLAYNIAFFTLIWYL
jgi:hypothetical protein